jgi:SNF2 family DNA or RNA helicase
MNDDKIKPLVGSGVSLSLTPRPDQLEDALDYIQWPLSANFSQVGTGKSLVSYLYTMYHLNQGRKVLVIMPPPLISQYRRNFLEQVKGHPYSTGVLRKDRAKRHNEMDNWDETGWPDVLYVSYNLFIKYSSSLRAAGYVAVICDEAHCISNPATIGFQRVFGFVHRGGNYTLHMMTATPSPTELRVAYGQIKLKDPRAYGSFDQFDRMHVDYEPRMITIEDKKTGDDKQIKKMVISGYKNVEQLHEKLMFHAKRRLQKEVLSIAAPTLIDHIVPLSKKHEALYQKLLLERMLELDNDELLIARNSSALRQMALQIITNPWKFQTEAEQFKLEEVEPVQVLLALIDTVDLETTKLIVFCHFKETVSLLAKLLSKYNPALIYGDSDTDKNVDKMLHDDTCRLGILNFQSGGAGFNLQSVCHQVIVYESTGSPGILEQGIGRVQRGGQEHPVVVWLMRYGMSESGRLLTKAFARAEAIKISLGDETAFTDFVITGVDIP